MLVTVAKFSIDEVLSKVAEHGNENHSEFYNFDNKQYSVKLNNLRYKVF